MTLFFTEIWERFSYYGMRAILILFMTTTLAQVASASTRARPARSTHLRLARLPPLPAGGWVADRILGARRSVLLGGIVIMCGHICLAVPSIPTFYTGSA